jgi:hypothetical protein
MQEGYSATAEKPLEAKLDELSKALREVERQLQQNPLDPAALAEFKLSIDHLRSTLWTLTKLGANRDQRPGDSMVVNALALERIRRATALNQEINLDIEASQVTVATPALGELLQKTVRLGERLQRLIDTGR